MANSFSVGATSSTGAVTPGGIIGDNQTPYSAAALIVSGDNLTTGDLNVGEPGEMGNLVEFGVEFWYQCNGTLPAADTTIVNGPLSSSGASRQYTVTLTSTSTFRFAVVDDAGGGHTANGTTSIMSGVWYHVVVTAQGGSVRVYVNGTQDGTDGGGWGSHKVRPLGATAGSLDLSLLLGFSGANTYFDEVATYRTGLTATRVAAHWDAGNNRGWRVQNSGARIISVLDVINSDAPRSIQTGARNVVPRYMSGQAPIEEIRLAVEAEDVDAAFFVAANGTLTFLADGHRSSSPYNTIQATFGDGPSGQTLMYEDIQTDYSEDFLINEWNVTRTGYGVNTPATQTVSDATSISRYFKRSQSLSDVPVTNDSDASTIATELLAKYKDPMYRITGVSFTTTDPNVTEAIFRRELMDKVRIIRTPPGGGSAIQQDVFIQRISAKAANDGHPWTVNWVVSPL